MFYKNHLNKFTASFPFVDTAASMPQPTICKKKRKKPEKKKTSSNKVTNVKQSADKPWSL